MPTTASPLAINTSRRFRIAICTGDFFCERASLRATARSPNRRGNLIRSSVSLAAELRSAGQRAAKDSKAGRDRQEKAAGLLARL